MKSLRTLSLLTAILALASASFSTTSCNTMKGLGRDVQNLGRSLEKKAAPAPGESEDEASQPD
jgi:predicted small secreted protein